MMRVRAAGPGDAAALGVLAAGIAAQPMMVRYEVTAQELQGKLVWLVGALPGTSDGAANERLIVAERAAGELLGLARFLVGGQFGRSGYLQLIALARGEEGCGVGGLLLDEVERQVEAVTADLFLLASDFNEGAQRLYERRGYARVGALPGYIRQGITELLYWKRLEAASTER